MGGTVIAVEEVPRELTQRYGILDVIEDDGRLARAKALIEKPDPAEARSTLSIVGRYILQPEVFRHLDKHEATAGGEIQLTGAIAATIEHHPLYGLRFHGRRFDCGTKLGFVQPNLAVALARDNLVDKIWHLNAEGDSRRTLCVRVWLMRPGISIILSPADRRRLEALVGDRNVAQKHVWRARIVLHSADGIGTNGIMRRTGKSKTCVWRWQERFAQEGYDGLLRDKTRPSRIPPLGPEVAERVVALTLSDPPAEATHWVAAMMAKATGISVSSVQRIWRAHGLRPHRVRQFKLSNDPDFVAKLRDVVGLYVDPPAHAIVLSVDEKSQIQALDRTQPGLPMKKGRLGTMTHDYKRHGTTTLFAALNVLEGKVIGRCMQRHRHQEFIRFLNAIEADIPAGKGVHVILTTTPPTSMPRCAPGSAATSASPSTSCRPPAPGSMPSRASSRSSRSGA